MNERFARAAAVARVDLAHERDFALARIAIRPSQANFQDREWYIDMASGNCADALDILRVWEQEFPDKMVQATMFGAHYVVSGDFDKASE